MASPQAPGPLAVFGWLAGWLAGWVAVWLAGRLAVPTNSSPDKMGGLHSFDPLMVARHLNRERVCGLGSTTQTAF